MGIAPDAFVQMSIQYAYRKMTDRFGVAYGTIMSRKFRQGRTEFMRGFTEESAAWINSMLEGTDGKEAKCLELLKKATIAHLAN